LVGIISCAWDRGFLKENKMYEDEDESGFNYSREKLEKYQINKKIEFCQTCKGYHSTGWEEYCH